MPSQQQQKCRVSHLFADCFLATAKKVCSFIQMQVMLNATQQYVRECGCVATAAKGAKSEHFQKGGNGAAIAIMVGCAKRSKKKKKQ